jgi:hypothetical protein
METISVSVSIDADSASIDGFVIASDAMERSNLFHGLPGRREAANGAPE